MVTQSNVQQKAKVIMGKVKGEQKEEQEPKKFKEEE